MKRHLGCLILFSLLLAMSFPMTAAAQEETGDVRVRIGYYAFDPKEVDTFVDGEPASVLVSGWAEGWWLADSIPGFPPIIICCAVTPYFHFSSGVHSFAFVPKGESLDAAILSPQEVDFTDGHVYALAVIGEIANHTLKLLQIDESEAFAESDPRTDFVFTLVHDIQGAPPLDFRVNNLIVAKDLGFGEFATYSLPTNNQSANVEIITTGDQRTWLFSFPPDLVAGISAFEVLTGTYPGTAGEDYYWVTTWGYPGDQTYTDGGAIAVGDSISGVITETGNRVRYTLTLDSDSSLNLLVNATGLSTNVLSGGRFDPVLYIYDAHGHLLFWNNEIAISDEVVGDGDAGVEGIALSAGDYTVEVGGYYDFIAGPYKLVVESAS